MKTAIAIICCAALATTWVVNKLDKITSELAAMRAEAGKRNICVVRWSGGTAVLNNVDINQWHSHRFLVIKEG